MSKKYFQLPNIVRVLFSCFFLGIVFPKTTSAQLVVTPGVSTATLLNSLVGQGMTVTNVTLNCASNAYGTFSNGNTTNMGLTNGIILTSGSAVNAIGPNNSSSQSTCNGTTFVDPQLTSLEPLATHDPCILEFDVVPQCDNLQIRFVFGSEEYPEFVNSGFNDAFGFWITGPGPACQSGFYNNTNVATLPDNVTIVSIDNVNNNTNSAFYVDNTGGTTIQYDGFTTVLTRNIALCACQTYHWKLAIADAGDCVYDSGVFVDFLTCSNALTATSSSVNTTCTGCTGSASVVASGQGPFTYSWSPTGGNAATTPSNLCAGTYTCTIDDAISCSPPYTVAVTVGNSGTLAATSTQTNETCSGGNNGTATVVPSGGTSPYTYSWSPSGGNAATATGLSPGTYTCTITDASGCITTQLITITQPPALTATSSQINVACNGGATGSATVVASGGTPGYTYAWAPSGGNAATASGLIAGPYTCTITDASGCTTTQLFTITQPPPLACTITATNSPCSTSSATASVSGGTSGYTYSWTPSGGNAATASGLATGNYTCTVTDAHGCVITQTVAVVAPIPVTATSSQTNVTCNGGTNGSVSVVASGGTPGYTYSWSPQGVTTATSTNLVAGCYTCTITDANGCTATATVCITQPTAITASPSQTNVACNGGATGSATATASGGTPGYTYSWAPSGGNAATATGLIAGTYTCTIIDANGCIITQPFTITQPTALSCSVSVVNAGCSAQGSATATPSGGTGPYTYSWSSGGTAATENDPPGTYTVTVTDANGCIITQLATIQLVSPVTATSSFTNIDCFGNTTGTATVVPSGGTLPYTYSWSPSGGNNATATGLSAGTYTCTITDANGCTTTQSFTITQPSQLTSVPSNTNVSCHGGNNGTATATTSGGTPGYTYSWTPTGGTNATATGLTAGAYTCSITDANGCVITQQVTITQPSLLSVTMVNDSVCAGSPSQIAANGSGGTGPYTYAWSNGPTTQTQNVTAATTTSYTVTVTDANGCTTTGISTVNVNALPTASITSNAVNGVFIVGADQLCFFGPSAGVTAWNWILQPGTSNQQSPCVNITSADTGTYCAELIVQNIHGCVDTARTCIDISDVAFSIPNVFTPNGDGTNDVFMITNSGMKTLHCIIYDRWGALIYEWDSPTGFWDGKTKGGGEAVDGVYYWTLNMEDYSGKTYDDHGFVHLIRGTK